MQSKIKSLIYNLVDYIDVDSTVDQLGVKFLYDALPPILTEGKLIQNNHTLCFCVNN